MTRIYELKKWSKLNIFENNIVRIECFMNAGPNVISLDSNASS